MMVQETSHPPNQTALSPSIACSLSRTWSWQRCGLCLYEQYSGSLETAPETESGATSIQSISGDPLQSGRASTETITCLPRALPCGWVAGSVLVINYFPVGCSFLSSPLPKYFTTNIFTILGFKMISSWEPSSHELSTISTISHCFPMPRGIYELCIVHHSPEMPTSYIQRRKALVEKNTLSPCWPRL